MGIPLTVLEDQYPFILNWYLEWHGYDVEVPLVAACQVRYPELRGCSFDRGFHGPNNQRLLATMLEHVALLEKGRSTEASREPGEVRPRSWSGNNGIRQSVSQKFLGHF